MNERTELARGKTKTIWDAGGGEVLIESRDDITAGDGAKHDVLEGKAVYSTRTTSNCFELLANHGIDSHYIGRVDERTFRARNVRMIPLELVARSIATGSFLKRRPDVTEGLIFGDLVIEFFHKDDPNHDPMVIMDLVGQRMLRYIASQPIGDAFLDEIPFAKLWWTQTPVVPSRLVEALASLTVSVFVLLEKAWAVQGVTLVDLKIEAGFDRANRVLLADVIDNDSWRLWPGGDKGQMLDKQVYRDLQGAEDPAAKAKELGKIKANYGKVAEMTDAFASLQIPGYRPL